MTSTKQTVLTDILACCRSWDSDVRILGNVRAGDAAAAIESALSMLRAAPQASADPTRAMLDGKPLDGEFAKVMADKFDEICIRPFAQASAKGAGDVVAWTNDAGDMEPISDAVKRARPDLYAKGYTRPLFYAAPQANARNAALEEAANLIETTNETTTVVDAGDTQRHLTPRKGIGNMNGLAWAAGIRALKSAPAADACRTDVRQAQPKRRPYNASASLSEYGIFPECDAAQAPANGADVALPPFADPDVQIAYRILCEADAPSPGEHWEGYAARLIIQALRQQRGGDGLHNLVAEKFSSGNAIPVERITITRTEWDAALSDTKGESNG